MKLFVAVWPPPAAVDELPRSEAVNAASSPAAASVSGPATLRRREPSNGTPAEPVTGPPDHRSVSTRSRIRGTLPKMTRPLMDNTVPIATGTTHAATS